MKSQNDCAAGPDNIQPELLKYAKEAVSSPHACSLPKRLEVWQSTSCRVARQNHYLTVHVQVKGTRTVCDNSSPYLFAVSSRQSSYTPLGSATTSTRDRSTVDAILVLHYCQSCTVIPVRHCISLTLKSSPQSIWSTALPYGRLVVLTELYHSLFS